jgi:hypothetical protein
MPATTEISVLDSPTALPTTLLTRKTVVVSNHGPDAIFVSTTILGGTRGIRIAPDATFTFPSGAPLWAICSVAQSGGTGSQTIVMELE